MTAGSARQLALAHAHNGGIDLMTGKPSEAAECFKRQRVEAQKASECCRSGRLFVWETNQSSDGRPTREAAGGKPSVTEAVCVSSLSRTTALRSSSDVYNVATAMFTHSDSRFSPWSDPAIAHSLFSE